ncbi:hypothetical protein TSUD_188990 [Trifolium subterraneum]|uniref:Aminotransferase-like plant mobile domain-containing protein n=1 Tax=Trifolium subterraneum TaxID=3900 RepID=A0A2Z6PTP5_TRISU|nr:hypothetical protein TSUD_188990 [Trifolium subterraneum]
MSLEHCNCPKCRYVAGYLTLLQSWIYHHFNGIGGEEDDKYEEHIPHASKYSPMKGQTNAQGIQRLVD